MQKLNIPADLESGNNLRFLTKLFRRSHLTDRLVALTILGAACLVLWPASELRSDNFIIYLPKAHHVLPLEVVGQVKYLPLLQVLNTLGKVSGLQEKRGSLKVWFGEAQLELRHDDPKLRVDKTRLTLAAPVRVVNGQWMVPVDFFTVVVPKLTLQAVEYPMGSNRIFIGGIKPNSFSVRLDPLANGARLTVQFTDKVAVRTAASNGKWIMFLGDNPTGPLESSFRFQDPYISELQFDDQDGVPKLVLTPTETGLNFYPVLAESGKVLLADVLKPPPAVASQSGPAQPSATVPSPSAATGAQEAIPATPPGPPLPIVVLDAGHGGSDVGGRSSEGVMEKDLVAQVVARVRLALLATQKYRILLTRPSDVDTTFEQRSTAANVARAAYFLTFHAGDLGPASPRIGVYTYHPPSPSALAVGDTPQSVFIPWTQVQESHLEESRQFAEALQQQLARIPGTTVDAPQGAPVRALRSVNAPAVAIELGRLSPEAAAGPLVDPNFQQQVAAAVAQVLGGMRGGA